MTDRTTYNCLVVDDEPIARKIITGYIEQLPSLRLAAECNNALATLEYLRNHAAVDIIFLDINMPNLSGLQMVKIVQPRQPVIFTTAYSEHAVESYELNAVDYLLKPFSLERFAKAAYKAIDVIRGIRKPAQEDVKEGKLVYIKSDGRNYPVRVEDILYCEARKNYTMVVVKNEQKLMPLISLSRFEGMLAEAGGDFLQVHRSFLVARKQIRTIGPNSLSLGNLEIPIGVQFKERFFKAMGMKGYE